MDRPSVLQQCEQCGVPLTDGSGGCLSCLLGGGLREPEETSPTRRRYQHYEIARRPDGELWELGRGAMGVTYRAIDLNLQLPVALKVIGPRYARRPEARARFLQEARAAAQLRHPNVASVFHFGTEPGTTLEEEPAFALDGMERECFYAMELVEGATLEAHLRLHGPLAVGPALEMALQVTRALTAAAERGLIHRDLKPANIMLTGAPEGVLGGAWIKVIDFGLAKDVSTEAAPSPAAVAAFGGYGGFRGTPHFASPEQLAGEPLDARSDLYSLGVTLWFALCGELPHSGASLAAIRRHILEQPLPVEQLQRRGVPPEIVGLLTDLLAPDPARRPAKAEALHARLAEALRHWEAQNSPAPRRSRWRAVATLLVLTALGLAGVQAFRDPGPEAAGPGAALAVLPFENLSPDPANAYFADGLQDDILNTLARIGQLRVVNRSSVTQFTAGRPRDLPVIARQLGVSHLLEGTVRRERERVLLNVTLLEVRGRRTVWAERYDRTLADAISLQSELATSVARALQTSLNSDEQKRVQTRQTTNPAAYLLYLQAREHETRATYLPEDFRTAETLYLEALRLDPDFALAHARLAATQAYLYRNYNLSPELKARAHAAAQAALRLRPDLGECHLALALCYYRIDRDFRRALEELDRARQLSPNDPEIDLTRAFIQRRQGAYSEALAGFERALQRDPLNGRIAQEIFTHHRQSRNWPAAREIGRRALAQAGSRAPVVRVDNARIELWEHGDLRPLATALAEVPAGMDPDGVITLQRWDTAMLARDYAAAERAAEESTFNVSLPSPGGPSVPIAYLIGVAALAAGETERAHRQLEIARLALEVELEANPAHTFRRMQLAVLYAYLGRRQEARTQGELAASQVPEARDIVGGASLTSMLALIYAHIGEPDRALDLIEHLLVTPGPVFRMESSLTLADLRLRWQWDPLRQHPRFQKLLADPEPKTRVR
ncbi:MAG: protein kinase [Verrucomicrobia bacterium]|nr:protein kinase [Verrucomicrobiota bacterium]